MYNYLLQIRFKLLSFAPQISITDTDSKEVFYIEQKVFALREAIKIFNNQKEKKQIYGIKTQQVIDFGARYFFYKGADESTPFGSIKEEGLRTLFKATYQLFDKNDQPLFTILETNPWVSIVDSLINMIPYAGLLTGYFLNPSYQVKELNTGKTAMILKKEASFFECQFSIELTDKQLNSEKEIICLLGIIMLIQLQKDRR